MAFDIGNALGYFKPNNPRREKILILLDLFIYLYSPISLRKISTHSTTYFDHALYTLILG